MKFIKKRLPALLLALLVAVLPLGLAVPVSAAEIYDLSSVNGYSYFSTPGVPYEAGSFPLAYNFTKSRNFASSGVINFSTNFISIFVPDSFTSGDNFNFEILIPHLSFTSDPVASRPRFMLSFVAGQSGMKTHYLEFSFFQDGTYDVSERTTGSFGSVTSFFSDYTFDVSSVGEQTFLSLSGVYSASSNPIIEIGVATDQVSGAPDSEFSYTVDYSFSSYQDLKFSSGPLKVPPSLDGNNSVLSVFSGVGSWLAGAVGNMTSMFWTPDGGLSVFGILAVCSLALAVILLFINLIAGWLKFR